MKRIAPNNQLPATHYIEVWRSNYSKEVRSLSENDCFPIYMIEDSLKYTQEECPTIDTIAIFRIRENKLLTKHKF